ncbi:MAG: restriction endonuclease [Bryobacteraceae bacterium]
MAIPRIDSVRALVLQLCGDDQEHRYHEMEGRIVNKLGLTADDLAEKLSNGRTKSLQNRVYWSFRRLEREGKLTRVRPGVYRIAAAGKSLLQTGPETTTLEMLEERPESIEEAQTPEERIEESHKAINEALADQLLDQLKAGTPAAFEQVVVDLLVAMGYGGANPMPGAVVGRSGDGGIDGIIKQDKLGLGSIYVQAKRWDASVGRPAVQSFSGALTGLGAAKGVMITTSRFTDDAKAYAQHLPHKLILIDGDALARLLIDHRVGVTTTKTYTVNRLDSDYFENL